MSSSSTADRELERLRAENARLGEHVKQLVRVERRLSLAQEVLEAQLQRVEILNVFALDAARAQDEASVLARALDVLLELFPLEQATALLADEDGLLRPAGARWVLGREARADVPAPAPHRLTLEEARFGTCDALADLGSMLPILDDTFGPGAGDAFTLALPVFVRGALRAVLLARRATPELSTLERLPTKDDLPFLRLLAAHVASAVEAVTHLKEARRQALENARLYDEARAAVQLRDEFLCVASHELKTPLTSLLLHAELLERTRSDDPRRRAQVVALERQARRLAALVDQLLAVSTMEAVGAPPPLLADVDLVALTREVVARLSDELARAGCAVTIDAPPVAVASVDAKLIAEVVEILLSNAAKFGAGRPIELSIESSGATAFVRVRDHGIGIAEEDRSRVFSRFARAVSYRHYGGLGLGLYLARRIVEAHGGNLSVQAWDGAGATFELELPTSRAVAHALGA